jgi:protein-disulfide isomerase
MDRARRNFLIGIGSLASLAITGCSPKPESKQPKPAPLLGDKAAPGCMILWGSYTCPFTAQLFEILTAIVADMPSRASLEWHHFPIHPPDPALHVAGLAFTGDHFWGFTKHILAEILSAGGSQAGLTPAKLAEFAQAEGGSAQMLAAAYADETKWSSVREDLMAGNLLGVTRTPALFYKGYFMTPNGIPTDTAAFDKSLRAMLERA